MTRPAALSPAADAGSAAPGEPASTAAGGAALDGLAAIAARVAGTPVALVTLVDEARQLFVARSGYAGPPEASREIGFCPLVADGSRALVIPDVRGSEPFRRNPAAGPDGIGFYAGVPLPVVDGCTPGTLCVLGPDARPDGLRPDQIDLLHALAAQVSVQLDLRHAIAQRDRLLSAQRAAITERTALARTQAVVAAAAGDLPAILDALIAGITAVVPAAEGAGIELVEGDDLVYRRTSGSLAVRQGLRMPLRASLAGQSVLARAPLLVRDVLTDPRLRDGITALPGVMAAAMAPITRGDEVLGVLKIQSGVAGVFTDHDLQIVQLFANTASAGLTEVRSAERLARSHQRIGAALDTGLVGFFDWDVGAGTIGGDAEFVRLYGLPPELAGRTAPIERLLLCVDEGERAAMSALIGEAVAEGRNYRKTFRIATPDGTPRWLTAQAKVIAWENGRAARYAGVAIDVTASKLAESRAEALAAAAEALLASDDPDAELGPVLARAAPVVGFDLACVYDCDGTGTVPRLAAVVGPAARSTAEPPGARALCARVAQEARPVVGDPAAEDGATRPVGPAAYPVLVRGTVAGVLCFVGPLAAPFEADALRFFETVVRCLSAARERLAREDDLVAAAERLEERVEERTRALVEAEAQLRQSQKMEAVGQLTGGLAHDFNNLLTAVTGGLELLRRRLEEGRHDQLDRYIGMAQTGAQRAAALTQRLLAFSRRQTLAPAATDVNRLLGGMRDLIDRTVGPAIELRFRLADDAWPTMVDASQLENALLNLCINARDAMPDGGLITVATANRHLAADGPDLLPPGDYLAVEVADTGVGIPPDLLDKVFEPFFTTKPLGEGTGLGLSMIYGFARQSGGRVRLASRPNQGTVATLLLPRHRGEVADGPAITAVVDAARQARDEVVLVIDDEAPIRALVGDVLRDAGFGVLEAGTGAEGIELLGSDRRIDLLLTDVGLPGGMNGRQVADAGRALRPGLPTLFVTGYAANAAVGAGQLEAGMTVLCKPFTLDALARRVAEMLAEACRPA